MYDTVLCYFTIIAIMLNITKLFTIMIDIVSGVPDGFT